MDGGVTDRPSYGDDSEAGEAFDILTAAKRWWRDASEASREWRSQAEEDFGFYSGDQWESEALAMLKEELRPAITFNRIAPIVDAVVGTEVNNRQQVALLPREPDDSGIAELLGHAADWARDQCDAEHEETDAFLDLVICGMGWTETRLDYDEDPEGMVAIERIDPLEMRWDPASRARNLADARYVMRARRISRDSAEMLFPEADSTTLHAAWADLEDGGASEGSGEPRRTYKEPGEKHTPKLCTIVEVQWRDLEEGATVRSPDGMQAETTDPGEIEAAQMAGFAVEPFKRPIWRRAFLGSEVIAQDPLPVPSAPSYTCMTGKRDRNAGCFYGLVRAMKDPQRWSNKWLSQILHIVNTTAKGKLLAEQDAFADPRKAEQEWARPDSIGWMNPGAIQNGKIQQISPPGFPTQLNYLLQYANESVSDMAGVNAEMMGMANRVQAGVLEYQRRQAGVTMLAQLFDGLRRYRKRQGRMLVEIVRQHLSDGRIIRIAGNHGHEQYLRLVRAPDTLKFDVVVDEAPVSPNRSQEIWSMLMQLMPMLMKAPLPPSIWAELLRFSPLPESVTAKLTDALMQAGQPDPQAQAMQQQAAMLEMRGKAAEVAKTEAETETERADAIKTAAEAARIQAETQATTVAEMLRRAMGGGNAFG